MNGFSKAINIEYPLIKKLSDSRSKSYPLLMPLLVPIEITPVDCK